jgi:dethiobiotin synthetase
MATYFITGTDTGVGKTVIAAGILRAATRRGLRVAGIKPLAAGGERRNGRLWHGDALTLQTASSVRLTYAEVNPVTLEEPMAPHVAAARMGISLEAAPLADHCRRMAEKVPDLLLAEGAGGWLVPLNDRETLADVCALLGWPVILVVGMRLGCLNHALLTAEAIARRGLLLGGWVANSAWPEMRVLAENIVTLAARLKAPCLGKVPWLAEATPESVAGFLDLQPLLR